MRHKERRVRLRPLTRGEARILRRFAEDLGVDPAAVAARPAALEVPGGGYSDVFDLPGWALGAAEALGARGLPVYSSGFYVGMLAGGRLKPSLPLAWRLSRLCPLKPICHVIDSEGERFFLYGKPVLAGHIIQAAQGLGVVVNEKGEALGWGVVKAKRGEPLLAPLADLGWYLRRGG